MKIRNLVALLALVTASMTYSTSAQTAQTAAEKQKTEASSEKGRIIDISKISLREGSMGPGSCFPSRRPSKNPD